MKRAFLFLLALSLCTGVATGADPAPPVVPALVEGWNLYIQHTGTPVTVAWDKANDALVTGYELVAYNMERRAFLVRGNVPQRDAPQIAVVLSRAGHYIFFVRSVNSAETDVQYKYSAWVDSITADTVQDGKKWWVYVHLAPPGGPVIE